MLCWAAAAAAVEVEAIELNESNESNETNETNDSNESWTPPMGVVNSDLGDDNETNGSEANSSELVDLMDTTFLTSTTTTSTTNTSAPLDAGVGIETSTTAAPGVTVAPSSPPFLEGLAAWLEEGLPWTAVGLAGVLLLACAFGAVCSLVCARCKRRREQRRVKLEEEDPPLFPGKADRTPLDGDRFPDCASVGAFFPSEKVSSVESRGHIDMADVKVEFDEGALLGAVPEELAFAPGPDLDSKAVGECIAPEPKVLQTPVVRAWLITVYGRYNPKKVSRVEELLRQYQGREAELVKLVSRKYRLAPAHFDQHSACAQTSAATCGGCAFGQPRNNNQGGAARKNFAFVN